MGGNFVNYFNRFGRQWQVYVEAEDGIPGQRGQPGLVLCAQQPGAERAADGLYDGRTPHRAGIRDALQRISAARKSTAAPRRATVRTRPPKRWRRCSRKRCRSRWVSIISACPSRNKKAAQGVSPALIFGLSLFCVFLILAAQYESWSLPFSVLLGTPIGGLGRVSGALIARGFREQCLCADRPDHADRFGGQKRHPDRGVRQDGIREEANRSLTPR